MEIKVFGVQWDTEDGIDEAVELDEDIVITIDETTMDDEDDVEELEDLISDTLSDTTVCHYGWESYECLNGKIFKNKDEDDGIKTYKVRAFFKTL